jgi:hypothetical protein
VAETSQKGLFLGAGFLAFLRYGLRAERKICSLTDNQGHEKARSVWRSTPEIQHSLQTLDCR